MKSPEVHSTSEIQPEVQIVHDHGHLNALLVDLDTALRAWCGDEVGFESEEGRPPLEEAREIVGLLKDDTYEHFEREEHGLFPNLRSEFPALNDEIDLLQLGHDQICESLEDLERSLADAEEAPLEYRTRVTARSQRLGELFFKHTAVEWEMIRRLLETLDEHRRAIIVEQLREIE
jgi:hemerythrin-like domain-containing protein